MTTRDIQQRPTAAEALEFFDELYKELTEEQFQSMNYQVEKKYCQVYNEFDRWKLVPDDFALRWAPYREPPISHTTKLLRWICSKKYLWHVVPWIRWFFFKLTHPVRCVYTHFVGLGVAAQICLPSSK